VRDVVGERGGEGADGFSNGLMRCEAGSLMIEDGMPLGFWKKIEYLVVYNDSLHIDKFT